MKNNTPRITIAVISDLNTDQRIQKIATSLHNNLGQVTVICRKLRHDNPTYEYNVRRIRLLFNKGFKFYAAFNIRLFFRLLIQPSDIIVSNDADTLLPCYYVSKLKRCKLVFDSHEIMSEVPEVIHRPAVQKFWRWIEQKYIPKIHYKYTVCKSLQNHYKSGFEVIRNVPYRFEISENKQKREEKMILYQGSVNMGRGIEDIIAALPFINNALFVIVGDGYLMKELHLMVQNSNVAEKVIFKGKMDPKKLSVYTQLADLGISIEENLGLNYYYALPNKLMDYIQAGVPVLVSDFPEMKNIVKKYKVGETLKSREPEELAQQINRMLNDEEQIQKWKENLKTAAIELCWENEEKILLKLYREVLH
ncbi:glycosyltransferase family 4 protein [Saccharicrinis sp. FJH62]|uniref:glycosyltransferase family 4 protein n=1 Tax=Saccharicrinis sp. FJH62 TaxID=3344657 RepID=UPI0035D50851